jgi:two-component system LytT family response regulator
MIKVLIVDDEENGAALIESYLSAYNNKTVLVGIASNADEAHQMILKNEPDLVFLDVNMPGDSGVDLLNRFSKKNFEVVFTTAYEKHAMDAFNHQALHYLLKPVSMREFDEAINRVFSVLNAKQGSSDKKVQKTESGEAYLTIPANNGYKVISVNEIMRCEADGAYTSIKLLNGKKYQVSQNLKSFEKQLARHDFLRVHRSHIIALNQIDSYSRGNTSVLILKDGTTVDLSSSKRQQLLDLLNKTED